MRNSYKLNILIIYLLLTIATFAETSFAQRTSRSFHRGGAGSITKIEQTDTIGLSVITIDSNRFNFCNTRRCDRKRQTKIAGNDTSNLVRVGENIGFIARRTLRDDNAEYNLTSIYSLSKLSGIISRCRLRRGRVSLSVYEPTSTSRNNRVRVKFLGDIEVFSTNNICQKGASIRFVGKRTSSRRFEATSVVFDDFESTPRPTITFIPIPSITFTPIASTTPTRPFPTPIATPGFTSTPIPTITMVVPQPTLTPVPAPILTVTPTIRPTNTPIRDTKDGKLLDLLPDIPPLSDDEEVIFPANFENSVTFTAKMNIEDGCTETGGYGEARVILWEDQKIAAVEYKFSNLSGPMVAAHIHSVSDGSIFFDLDQGITTAGQFIVWKIEDNSVFSAEEKISLLKEFGLYVNVHTAKCPGGEIKGILHRGNILPNDSLEPKYVPNSAEDTARFLNQATFGATLEEISNISEVGITKYLDAQLNIDKAKRCYLAPKIREIFNKRPPKNRSFFYTREAWWDCLLNSPEDEVCHRVAFALSQQWVVSGERAETSSRNALAAYHDILKNNCFGNIRTIMQRMTLSPAMGAYLDMLNNSVNELNENYAREILQLFTIGLEELNPDGSVVMVNGKPKETYTQDDITELSRILTGWSWDGRDFGTQSKAGSHGFPWFKPMKLYPDEHDKGEKKFLGVTYSANMNPMAELNTALNNIFNHKNICPFSAKNLIKQLVTSNPTGAYVRRVVAKCENNGSGVRGDLKAMVRTILTDPQARDLTKIDNVSYGKLRQPTMVLSHLVKLAKVKGDNSPAVCALNRGRNMLKQVPLHAPTVFNFFTPEFITPYGNILGANLVSPEFQMLNKSSIINFLNYFSAIVRTRKLSCIDTLPDNTKIPYETTLDFSYLDEMSNEELIRTLDLVFTGSQLQNNAEFMGTVFATLRRERNKSRRTNSAFTSFLSSPEVIIRK